MAMIHCSQCGNTYDSENAFCTNCGQPTAKSQEAQKTPEAPAAAPQAQSAPRQTAPQPGAYQQRPQQTQSLPYQAAQQIPNYGQQYRPYPMPTQGKVGGGFGWIVFMRVILWIFFGLILLASLVSGVQFMAMGDEGVLIGFGIMLGGTLVAFLSVALGMISLNNASNLHKIATNSAHILDELRNRK